VRAIPAAVLPIAALALGTALSACDGEPLLSPQIVSDTVTIAVPDAPSGLASAIDLVRIAPPYTLRRRPEQLQDSQQWDFALRRTDGGLALRPIVPVGGGRGAGLARSGTDWDALTSAPRPVQAYLFETVPLEEGATFVARSRQYGGSGMACVKFAKLQVLALDVVAGTAHLRVVVNENCEDERLTA
jgi:hypothetical protein